MNTLRNLHITLYLALILILGQLSVSTVSAQRPVQVECGSELESAFSRDAQVHSYQIDIERGTSLVIHVESLATSYENLLVDIELNTPRGNSVAEWTTPWGRDDPGSYNRARAYRIYETETVETDPLPETGVYRIRVIGYTDTGSPYRLIASCIYSDDSVESVSNLVSLVQCGSIVENAFTRDSEVHRYYLSAHTGDSMTLFVESAATNYENLLVNVSLITPRGNAIAEWTTPWGIDDPGSYNEALAYGNSINETETVETDPLPETGIYRIRIIGYTDTGSNYIFYVGCMLRDGTVIDPGDIPPTNLSDQ